MKLSKSCLAAEIDILQKSGLLSQNGKSSKPGLSLLQLLNEPAGHKGWLLRSTAVLEPWQLMQLKHTPNRNINPLLLYISQAQAGIHLSPHPLIDTEHLLEQLGSRYVKDGYTLLYCYLQLPQYLKQKISPTPWFDPEVYLRYNTDLSPGERNNPFVHYLLQGGLQDRPASLRFDPRKWKEKNRKLLHPVPVVDFLVRRQSDPGLRPTRPNLPGGITAFSIDGYLSGWVRDPEAQQAPQVEVWWNKQCISKARLQLPDGFAAQQTPDKANFKAMLPAFLAEELVKQAKTGNLSLQLRTTEGHEIGPPKGWEPETTKLQQWLNNLNASASSEQKTTAHKQLLSPSQLLLQTTLLDQAKQVRRHEHLLGKRLAKRSKQG